MHWALFILCVLQVLLSRANGATDCTNLKGASGERIDLGPIIGQTITTNDGFSDYKVSVCQDNMQCGACAPAGFCQVNEFFSDCLGKFSAVSVMADGTVQLLYDEGDWGNTGQLKLNCNPAADTFQNIKGEQFYKVTTADSKYACAAPPGGYGALSLGTVIMIVITVLVVVYLVVGILWNKFREEKEGVDLLPNVEFWTSVPGLVKDGAVFTKEKISGAVSGHDGL